MKAKFNIIDVVVILLIIAVGVCGYLFLNRRTESVSTAKNVKVQYNIQLTMQKEYMTDLFKAGDKVLVGEKEKMPATVIGAEVTPAHKSSFDGISGKFIDAEVPDNYDITVMLESNGVDNYGSVSVDGTAVRVGMSTLVRGREYAGFGYVTDINIAE